MNKIRRWLGIDDSIKLDLKDWALLPMPFMVFFSYRPLISIGTGAYNTHYELSLIEIYLVVFVVLNLASIWRQRRKIMADKAAWLIMFFGLYNTLSLAWTPNFARGTLTAGTIWLLIFVFFAIMANDKILALKRPLFRVLIVSSIIVSFFALYQMVAANISYLAPSSLLCAGCLSDQFGFARPNAFTIEPQFLGSLLLAPILLLAHRLLKAKQPLITNLVFGFLLFTMILTLSRGALFGLAVGMIVLFIVNYAYSRRYILPIGIAVASVTSALFAQGLATQLNPLVSDTFLQGVTKSVHQLSLGIIDLRSQPAAVAPTERPTDTTPDKSSVPAKITGYVERSTNERLDASCLAASIWSSAPRRAVFGTGLGGTGYYFEHYPIRSSPLWCKTNI